MKRGYQVIVLAILVLSAYYPAVLSGLAKIDDEQMVRHVSGIAHLDLGVLFFPATRGGSYYRPILNGSFIIDKFALGLQPGLMHLENVLLHLLNAMLVFFLALYVMPPSERRSSMVPFAAAALFGLHPLTTESVNWISGRTDVLAGTFVLASAAMLMRYRESRGIGFFAASLGAFLCAVLTKETSLAFLPGSFVLLSAERSGSKGKEQGALVSGPATALIGVLSIAFLFFLLRSMAFTSNSSRIGLTMTSMANDWIHSMLLVFRAFGFYLKKMVFPWPLNFAIMAVDPLYELLAVPAVMMIVIVALRGTILSAYVTAGILLILPSFVLIFHQIAWTPYAERYVYIALSFLIIPAVVSLDAAVPSRYRSLRKILVGVLLLIFFVTTFHRSLEWKDQFSLVRDTVRQSPWSRTMAGLYASLLADRGEYDEAKAEAQRGAMLPYVGKYDDHFDMVIAFVDAKQDRTDEAIRRYEQMLAKGGDQRQVILRNLVMLYEIKKDGVRSRKKKRILNERILAYNKAIYNLSGDPMILYQMGNDALRSGLVESALRYFRDAREKMALTDPYRSITERRIDNLLKEMSGTHAS